MRHWMRFALLRYKISDFFSSLLEVPMYQLFYDGENPPKLPNFPKDRTGSDIAWGRKPKYARLVAKFCQVFSRMEAGDLRVVLFMAQKMARRKNAVRTE
jgi:hypothetical protein